MADSTKASAGAVGGHGDDVRARRRSASSPSVAITIGAALWAR